jgi:hypothetical protein
MYLASYFLGGLVGSAVIGALFQSAGWPAAVAAIGCALALTAWMAGALVVPKPPALRVIGVAP